MRFDFIPFFNAGENIPWDRVIRMMREQTQIVEAADFTTVWITEHHFAHNGYLNAAPNPILVCADLAAHSKTIRVGQAPVVLPDWHPLRVAEDIALLDNLTGGRVDFGAGKGINERVNIQFNLEADRRNDEKCYALFRESLEVIVKAWTENPFKHKGNFYQFPVPGWKEPNRFFEPFDSRYYSDDGEYVGMYVHPRPLQKPHPPVWLMSNSPYTHQFAAERGYGVICFGTSMGNIRECWSTYREALSLREKRPQRMGRGVGLCMPIFVADTMEEADRQVRQSVNNYWEYISGSRPKGEWTRRSYLAKGETLSSRDRDCDWFDFLQAHDVIWVGTADYLIEKIAQARETVGLDHLMILQQHPGVPYEKIRASLVRFIERVVPKFGTLAATESAVLAPAV